MAELGVAVHPLAFVRAGAPVRFTAPRRETPARRRELRELRREAQQIQRQDGGGGGLSPSQLTQLIQELETLLGQYITLFEGVPRALKSLEVAQRILNLGRDETSEPTVRLAQQMMRLIRGGDVLSESGAGLQRFYQAVHHQALIIARESGLPVHEVQRAYDLAIFGQPPNEGPLKKILREIAIQPPATGPQGPPGPAGGGGGGGGQPLSGQPAAAGDGTNCAAECVGALELGPEAYAGCIAACEGFTPLGIARSGRQLGERIGRGISNLLQPQRPLPQLPPLEPQRPLLPIAPILDQTTPCESCDRLGRQRQQLQQEIHTEQQQQLDQRIQQRQQQLDQLEQLEHQPAEQRDIPQELIEKQELLQQIEQDLADQLPQQPPQQPPPATPATQPTGRVPHLDQPAGEQQQLDQIAAQKFAQRAQQPQLQQPQTGSQAGVTFCVGCSSEEDAILFLNGEPSNCSVIPGSTKPLALPAS